MKLFMTKYPMLYQAKVPREHSIVYNLWTVAVYDDAQFALWKERQARRYHVTVKAARRDFKELTGQEIPTDPDPFLGCQTIHEYLKLTKVFDALEGKQ